MPSIQPAFRGEPSERKFTFDLVETSQRVVRIKVVGVGGAGGNAVNRMIDEDLTGVDFIAVNTDLQVLDKNQAQTKIQIGKNLTRGLGSGGVPEVGRKAIEENKDLVARALADSDMVFITCGMGGGTGTGAAPVVAEIARDVGALTVAVVTRPFEFEGAKRFEKAEQGLYELKQYVDTLIVIHNQKLVTLVDKKTPIDAAFKMADEVLLHATKGISDVITVAGLVNVDFADVRTVMSQKGDALMGSGVATGESRAREAAQQAISSKIIDDASIGGATGVLVNITGGKDLALTDIHEATSIIHEAAGPEANIIFGAVLDPSMTDAIRVTVIATGFHRNGYRIKTKPERTERREARSLDAPAPVWSESEDDRPVFDVLDREILSEVFEGAEESAGDFMSASKDNLSIPTFIRRQMR
jgi:cell division protein FtsZ